MTMSGLRPVLTLRNTFISESSPNATEELLCSPENSVECVSRSRSWPGQPVEGQLAVPRSPPAASSKARR